MSFTAADFTAAIWQVATARIRKKLAPASYEQYFNSIVVVELTSTNTLVLGVSDDFFAEIFCNNYADLLEDALANIDGTDYSFELKTGYEPKIQPKVAPASQPAIVAPAVEHQPFHVTMAGYANKAHKPLPQRASSHGFTFANFVVGEENRYAFAAAQNIAQDPGGICNPLYIYGDTGTGKTHLIKAVKHELLQNFPNMVIRYATCEEILNDFVESIRNAKSDNQFSKFRASLRDVDALLVDDIHALARKKELQEQFFNAFNALYHENKQLILTSDKQPCEIDGLEARLISRFESGLTVEILPPGYESRLAILRQMAETFSCYVPDDVLDFIAQNITTNVRRLRGALVRVVGATSISGQQLTVELAEDVLHAIIEDENATRVVSFEAIQTAVADHFGLRLSDILSNRRPKNIAEPRMVAMYLCRQLTSSSFPDIAAAFGKTHATILNAMKKVPELCDANDTMKHSVALLSRQLKSRKS